MQNRWFVNAFRPAAIAATLMFAAGGAARGEPVPLPRVDYEAKAKLLSEGTLFVRHSGGKMRIEMEIPAVPQTVVGIIDLNTKKMVMLVPIPGLSTTAMEIDFGEDATFGQVIGDGHRVGTATVNGEPCTLWEVTGAGEQKKEKAIACLSADNIPLRTQANVGGGLKTIFEVTEIKRAPQNPAEFKLPPDVRVMKLPKGLKGIPGIPRL